MTVSMAAVDAASGASAAGASGTATAVPVVVLVVSPAVLFVVHFLVVWVELATVVDEEERWLTRRNDGRRRRRLQLAIGDQILFQLQ